MSSQVNLREKKQQCLSIVSLPTDSVIVDHAVKQLMVIQLIIIQFSFGGIFFFIFI
jgi:hypothetical protein